MTFFKTALVKSKAVKPVLWYRIYLPIQALGSNGHFAILNWACRWVLKKYYIRKAFSNLILNFKISLFCSPLQREHPHLKEVIFDPRRDSTHNKRSLITPLCEYKRNLQLNGVSTEGNRWAKRVTQHCCIDWWWNRNRIAMATPALPPPSRQQEIAHERYFRKPIKREKLRFFLSNYFKCTYKRCFQEMGG